MNNDLSIEEKIKKDVENSGFPLEIQISSELEKRGWRIYHNQYYIDPDLKKPKEIDLLAVKPALFELNDNKTFYIMFFTLIIECKKSSKHPWVFFTRKRQTHDDPEFTFKYSANFGKEKPFRFIEEFDSYNISQIFDLSKLHQYRTIEKATNYYVAFTKPGEKISRQIFEAVNSVFLALKNEKIKQDSKFLKILEIPKIFFCIFQPIIILEGELFQINLEKDDFKVERAAYIPLILNSWDDNIDRVLIDVVNRKSVNDFFNLIEKDFEFLKQKFHSIKFKKFDAPVLS